MRKISLILAMAFLPTIQACKSSGGDQFASCAVSTSELETDATATDDYLYTCEPTASSVNTLIFKFFSTGEGCALVVDGNGDAVSGGCGGTWSRSSCASATLTQGSDTYDFDAINPTNDGFGVNLSSASVTYSYSCTKSSVPK